MNYNLDWDRSNIDAKDIPRSQPKRQKANCCHEHLNQYGKSGSKISLQDWRNVAPQKQAVQGEAIGQSCAGTIDSMVP